MPTIAERVASLEVQMRNAIEAQNKHFDSHREEQHRMSEKLDELLALRNKGIGAFWLATSLAGVGAISIVMQILRWFGVKFGVSG